MGGMLAFMNAMIVYILNQRRKDGTI
jgi:hypothetical protein